MAEEEQLNIVIEAKAEGLDAIRDTKDLLDDVRNSFLELDALAGLSDLRNFFDMIGAQLGKIATANIPVISGFADLVGEIGSIPVVGIPAAAALAALAAAILGVAADFALVVAGAAVFTTVTVAGFGALAIAAAGALGPLGAIAAAMIFLTDHVFTDQQKAIKEQIAALGAQRDAAIAAETWTKAQQVAYTENVAGLKAQLAGLHDPLGQIEQDFAAMLDAWGTKAAPFAMQIVDWLDSMIPRVQEVGNAVIDWFGGRMPLAFDLAKRAVEPIFGFFKGLGDIIGPFIDKVMLRLIGTWSVDWPAAGKIALEALKNLLDNLVKFVDWFFVEWPKIQPIVQQVMQKAGEFIQNFGKVAAEVVGWFVEHWPEITKTAKDLEPVLEILEVALITIGVVLLSLVKITDQVVGALGKIRDAFEGAAGAALDFAAAASGAPGLEGVLGNFVGGLLHPGGPRQAGGPVLPGGVYTVGEAGPETLVMGGAGGFVLPDGGAGRGAGTNIFYIQAVEPEATAQAVLARLLTST